MAARQYSIAEARNRLPAIVHDTEKGTRIELTRRGKPVAVLMSIKDYGRLARARPDPWTALEHFRTTHDLEDLDAESVFADTRDGEPGREVNW